MVCYVCQLTSRCSNHSKSIFREMTIAKNTHRTLSTDSKDTDSINRTEGSNKLPTYTCDNGPMNSIGKDNVKDEVKSYHKNGRYSREEARQVMELFKKREAVVESVANEYSIDGQ